jgi:nucleoid-associated protein YgaU
MEKEVKIGMAVILVLLIAFGAVLTKRLYSSRASTEALTADGEQGEKSLEAADLHKETINKQSRMQTAGVPLSPPTVVAASAESSTPPVSAASDADQWSTASDANSTKVALDNSVTPPPTPSFMPSRPKSDSDNHDDRYGTAGRSAPSRPWQQKVENESSRYTVADRQPRNSLEPADRYAKVEVAEPAATPGSFPRASGQDAPQHSNAADRGDSALSTFGSAASEPENSGDYRNDFSNGYSSSEVPSESGRRYTVASYRSDRSDPFARYQADDLRNSAALAPGNNEKQRFTGAGYQKNSGHTYTVAEGDSVYDIARYELGKAARWVEIYDLNRDILGNDLEHLVPGTEIIIPDLDSQNTDPVSRRLTRDYYR